jgi:hypothetical protein
MPTFNILLAYDTTKYGCVEVEADTWKAAVASLTHDSWYDSCHEPGDEGWEQRVVHVETENGDILAEGQDINYDCSLVHYMPVVHRLTTILNTCDLSDEAATALTDYIQELQAMVQDPIFKKEIN